MKFSVSLAALCTLAFLLSERSALADRLSQKVDKLFAPWAKRDSPGCALAVIRDGRIVHKRGYGMADLERDVPIRPDTVFHIASTSKQFTAFCIALLEKEGNLKLDDDVRKYLPELHDFGTTITIRYLLNHTSGLRDQWSLLSLAGWRMDDVITEDDILGLVWRQRELNFEPGTDFNYSNTGYTLAAKIVERVSGKPLPQFAKERIFQPLGMERTHFHADHEAIVKNRALSYNQVGEGNYRNAILSYGNVGATSLHTTVVDLAKWDENFYHARVGGSDVLARMHEPGKLKNGQTRGYALGLEVSQYRGLRTVEHGGGDAGFRCTLLRFPDQRLSVAILSNHGEFDPEGMARKVADIYLDDKLKPAAQAAARGPVDRKEVPVAASLLDAYAGEYRILPGITAMVRKEEGGITIQGPGQPKAKLLASSDTEFFLKGEDITITFAKPVSGKSEKMVIHRLGQDLTAPRVTRKDVKPADLSSYTGRFFSEELDVVYTIFERNGKLYLRHPRRVLELKPEAEDAFEAPYPIVSLTFTRGADRKLTGFKIDAGRVRGVRFFKTEIKAIP